MPAFCVRLLESGAVAEAVRAGRQAMLLADGRVSARGEHPLQDWLVPVLYQQEALDLPVAALDAHAEDGDPAFVLPDEARYLDEHGLTGRQRAIQSLERALLTQPQAAILIHGMAGIGKSTLVRGLLAARFDADALGAPLSLAVVFLLRTHIRIRRHADGRWDFLIERKPDDSKLLTDWLKRLTALLPGTTPGDR